jgi:hypothetical protein
MADDPTAPAVPEGAGPAFLYTELSDDALQTNLERLQDGLYAPWRLVGEAGYLATQMDGGRLAPCRFRKLWLETEAGRRLEVILMCPPHSTIWRLQALPEA